MTRSIDLRISAPPDTGFIVWSAGEPVAAFTTRAQLCAWLEDTLGSLPGELEREASLTSQEHSGVQADMSNVERMPNVARPRTEPPKSRRWLGG